MVQISEDFAHCSWRNLQNNGNATKKEGHRLWLAVSDEFTLCVLRTTHAVAQWLCTVHLLMCMDIEANPGPDESNNILQIMEWKFAQVMYGIRRTQLTFAE